MGAGGAFYRGGRFVRWRVSNFEFQISNFLIMLSVSNINVSIGGSRILRSLSMEIPANSLVCLMGRNGVGKSTTLKTIVGLLKPSAGSIRFLDKDLLPLKPEARAHAGLAYVPQGRDIFPNLTVEENLRIGLVANGRKANGQMARVYELFPVLKEMLSRKGGVLSGGQQQQLAIARAILTEPKLLILDEPTEGIQPSIIDQIGDALLKIKKETGISILLVEQYLDFAQELGDIFYILDRGAVVAHGPIAELTGDVVKQHLMV
jgi:urea transport system ATP-binding protein